MSTAIIQVNSLAYTDELESSLKFIRETLELTVDEKRRFFRSANTNLGKLPLGFIGHHTNGYLFLFLKGYPPSAFLEVLPSDTVCFSKLFCTKHD